MLLPDNTTIIVKGVVLMAVCDLPAKCECLNFTQYNGFYGCPSCLCRGNTFRLETCGSNVHVYPYTDNCILRTSQQSVEFAATATPDRPVMGVKGSSILSRIMPDFVKGMGIDRMHGADGGLLKKMMKLLLDVKFRSAPFSLYNVIDLIDARILSIKPPAFIHRMPRTVRDVINWKTSELKCFLFYYSIPIFEGVMRMDYYEHYLRLVIALKILSSEAITEPMLLTAHDLLCRFVREFEIMYGIQFCTVNIHQLLHYSEYVKNLGPLWAYTCYEYENLNGLFLKQIHGTLRIDTQIARSQNVFLKIIGHIESVQNEKIKEFCLKKTSKNYRATVS